MTMNDDELLNRFLQSNLPGGRNDIRNPSEDFVINVIKSFFNQFSIDADKIMDLTEEQLEALLVTSKENAQIASIINLREAIMSIGPKLFIKDLSITDITTPTEKKFKNRLKMIINFILYATQKKEELKIASDEIFKRSINIETLNHQKEGMIEEMNDIAKETAQKMSQIEKMKADCEKIKLRIEKNKSYVNNLEKDCHKFEQIKIDKRDELKRKKIELQKLGEKNELLKSQIVKSPAKYKQWLHELTEEQKNKDIKKAELEKKVVTFNAKVQDFKDALNIVKEESNKIEEFKAIHVKLTKANEKNEQLKLSIEDSHKQINNQISCNDQNGKIDKAEVSKCNVEVTQILKKLHKDVTDLTNEKKMLEKEFEMTVKKENEIIIEIDNGKKKISQIDSDTDEFLNQLQQLYTNEMKNLDDTHNNINTIKNLKSKNDDSKKKRE
ncbi:nuclease SbcCD subunit C-like [Aphidius gifuensis]|uniref:nuclease SbcCD subunit C-like n=1 Tax=Aphidius gifuensis TaxID=684658 RepID=UPI001CDD5B36|nr:nuclease SbcCD subunit C-like [Aphidius gifuensis]